MKKLILFAGFLFTLSAFSQTTDVCYEGIATVKYQDGFYASIDFDKTHKSFIVKCSDLEIGKQYEVVIKPVKLKGTKETAKVIFYHKASQQNVRDMRRVKDSLSRTAKIKWI